MKTFILASALVSSYSQAAASDSAFDADFLRKDSQEIPEQFYHPDQVDAGVKTADIVLNGHILFKTKVEFITTRAGESATPCLTQALLHQTGLDTHLDELAKAGNETCYDFLKKWPDARITYDESMQQLVISAPQAATSVAGQTEMIDPSLWDNGVNALRLGYSGCVYHTDNHSEDSGSGSSDNAYLSLNSGVNLGSWRFYSFDTFNKSDLGWEQFTVPYTALPNMLRPGTWRYSLSAGRYRDDGLSCQPLVAQGSLQYGWDRFTLSDLIVAGEGYQSMALSSAVNLGVLGSVSLDWALERHQSATDSNNADDENISDNGRALRLLYARRFDSTDTSLQVMGFRYQSKDFMDFPDYASWRWGDSNTRSHRKNEVQATLNQGMGDFGNGYLTLQQDSYYDSEARDTSLTLGYSFMIKFVNVSLNYSYQKNSGAGDDSDDDRQFSLNLSIPLDAGDRNSRTLSVSTNSSNHDSGSQMATVSGTELDNALSYSLSAQHDSSGYSPAASMAYRNSMVNMNVSASTSRGSSQYSAGASGGVVAYGDGLVLSQQLGDTIAIIETPGARDISVEGQPGVSTNRWGRAVVPSVSAYRDNPLSLDTRHAADNVELVDAGQNVIPTHGAVVVRRFQTKVGRRAIVMLSLPDGKPAPFGASAWQEKEQVGMVADNGLLYLNGILADGSATLHVDLGNHAQCQFTLPDAGGPSEPWYQQINAVCR